MRQTSRQMSKWPATCAGIARKSRRPAQNATAAIKIVPGETKPAVGAYSPRGKSDRCAGLVEANAVKGAKTQAMPLLCCSCSVGSRTAASFPLRREPMPPQAGPLFFAAMNACLRRLDAQHRRRAPGNLHKPSGCRCLGLGLQHRSRTAPWDGVVGIPPRGSNYIAAGSRICIYTCISWPPSWLKRALEAVHLKKI